MLLPTIQVKYHECEESVSAWFADIKNRDDGLGQ